MDFLAWFSILSYVCFKSFFSRSKLDNFKLLQERPNSSAVCCLLRVPKKNTSHENEVQSQDTTHLIQRPCYQRGSPCQDPGGNRTTQRPPDHRKETQTAVLWSCLPFIRSGQNHLARHSERGKKTRQTEEEVGRQHQGIDKSGVRQVPEGSGKQGKMEETGCEII